MVAELAIDSAEYARGRVFQPITAFRTGCIGGPACETDFGAPVSYGIRRREFDHYLVQRSGARLLEGVALGSLEHRGDEWVANGQIRARFVIGAGGHFCPVARWMGAKAGAEAPVVAQEAEFELDPRQLAACAVRKDTPELYFCADMRGYGWCFRKENVLNVGLGRADQHRLSEHVADFLRFLSAEGRIGFEIPAPRGHAYLLYGTSPRKLAGDGLALIGDAAGLAYSQSGEGILPAIQSGLLAAEAIVRGNLAEYPVLVAERFGKSGDGWAAGIGRRLPPRMINGLAKRLFETRWFVRDVVLRRWFLHAS